VSNNVGTECVSELHVDLPSIHRSEKYFGLTFRHHASYI